MLKIRAHAKINLALDVVGKRPDGYHNLKMVMQSIRLSDEILLRPADEISVQSDLGFLPCDERNIAFRAARLFFEEIKSTDGIFIQIKKHIPVGGGLGGGSADAAAVLMGLNRLYNYPVSYEKLLTIGLACGADVPFCMTGGTCLAEGLGERLTLLPPMPLCHILLLRPRFSVSTKKIFGLVNMETIPHHPDMDKLLDAVKNRNLKGILPGMFNSLESLVDRPEIAEYKSLLLKEGADSAMMTGSGSVVYGIFMNEDTARRAKDTFLRLGLRPVLTTPTTAIF